MPGFAFVECASQSCSRSWFAAHTLAEPCYSLLQQCAALSAQLRLTHQTSCTPLVRLCSDYLLTGGFVHVVASMYRTYKFKLPQLARAAPDYWHVLRLALSGTILAIFVVTHLLDFRFGKMEHEEVEVHGVKMHDIYALQKAVFSNSKHVAWYIAAVAALGIHLWFGWPAAVRAILRCSYDANISLTPLAPPHFTSTAPPHHTGQVRKMDIDRADKAGVIAMGKTLILPVCGIFSGVVLYTVWLNKQSVIS